MSIEENSFFLTGLQRNLINYTKLATPLASKRKAHPQRKIVGSAKNKERIRSIEEERSTILKRSPLKRNRLLQKSKPTQKSRYGNGTSIPKVSMRKAMAEAISTAPNSFTIMKESMRKCT